MKKIKLPRKRKKQYKKELGEIQYCNVTRMKNIPTTSKCSKLRRFYKFDIKNSNFVIVKRF